MAKLVSSLSLTQKERERKKQFYAQKAQLEDLGKTSSTNIVIGTDSKQKFIVIETESKYKFEFNQKSTIDQVIAQKL